MKGGEKMKKLLFVVLALCLISSFAFAQETATANLTLKGDIIDNKCSSAQKAEGLADFVKAHTKDCALACESSGYSIYADGKLMKFDAESNKKVTEFLKNAESKLQVVVEAKEVNGELSLISIKNQE